MNSKSTLKIVITIILITSTYQFAFGQEDISFEITEFGTLDSHQGYYREMSINDEHHETDFLFEESGYVRWYAYKMSWQDEFQILPEGTYLVKSENMQIGDEWNSWWDGEAVATVHDTSTIAIGEGLLAFTYKVEYRGPDWELKTVIWWCNDIGWVKFAVNDRKTITDWAIEGGTGYHPLFVGNRWEFMDQSELNTVTTSIDSTTFIFNHTCFVANMKDNGIWSRTFYWEVQNDTVYTRGNLNRGEPLRQENYVFSPLFPTIGSHWWSRWPSGGLNRFYVSDTLTVESPAGSFLSYKCDVTDSIT
ncbi:MAG: hypothetical protein GY855_08670, partial [candidate division Zixibacteria bacterium]|nr:hypothetical protein [candidate division Zixibacteria bacterium]